MVVGAVGNGWKRSPASSPTSARCPDRYLSAHPLLLAAIEAAGAEPGERAADDIGRLVAHLAGLRRMSSSIAGMLDRGEQPVVEAALLKDMGTTDECVFPRCCG